MARKLAWAGVVMFAVSWVLRVRARPDANLISAWAGAVVTIQLGSPGGLTAEHLESARRLG